MHRFQDLDIWKKSMDLAEQIYKISVDFPTDEKYGMTSQIKRSAISIPSNIAEGAGRNNSGEFHQFLGIALGSLAELETQLKLSTRLKFITNEVCEKIENEITVIRKMIYSLQRKLN